MFGQSQSLLKFATKTTHQRSLEKLRLLIAREIFRNCLNTHDQTPNIWWHSASGELCDQYSLKVFLNWLATKSGFPTYTGSMQSAERMTASLPGGWTAFDHIYPFYSYFEPHKEQALQDVAFAYLDGALQPCLEDAGVLYMQTLAAPMQIDGSEAILPSAGKRRRLGEYYTAPELVDYCIDQTGYSVGEKTLLDPACGTGNFLLGALKRCADKLAAIERLYGIDIDGKAVSIARVLLIFACARELEEKLRSLGCEQFNRYLSTLLHGQSQRLVVGDATCGSFPTLPESYDVVASNPPYISFGSRNQPHMARSQDAWLRSTFPSAAQYKLRMHSIFQELALRYARAHGDVVLLVPDAFLTGAYYQRLRQYIDENARVVSFTELPESTFKDATAGRWCVAHYRKGAVPDAPHTVTLRRLADDDNFVSFAIDYEDLRCSDKLRFRLLFVQQDVSIARILDRLPPVSSQYRGHTGIRARNGQASIISMQRFDDRYKPGLVSGAQVKQHEVNWQGHYLLIDKQQLFAGGFDEKIVCNPKVLVRQTADRLIAAVDVDCLFHLNNVHAFAPLRSPQQDGCLFLAALMNSRLWLYLYRIKSREERRALAQIDIEMVESLPLPAANRQLEHCIARAVAALPAANGNSARILRAIDRAVYDLYHLPPDAVAHIEGVTSDVGSDALPHSADAFDLLQSLQSR